MDAARCILNRSTRLNSVKNSNPFPRISFDELCRRMHSFALTNFDAPRCKLRTLAHHRNLGRISTSFASNRAQFPRLIGGNNFNSAPSICRYFREFPLISLSYYFSKYARFVYRSANSLLKQGSFVRKPEKFISRPSILCCPILARSRYILNMHLLILYACSGGNWALIDESRGSSNIPCVNDIGERGGIYFARRSI